MVGQQSDTGQRGRSTRISTRDSSTWSDVSTWINTGQCSNMEQERSTLEQHGATELNIRLHGSTRVMVGQQSDTGPKKSTQVDSSTWKVNMDQHRSTHQDGTRTTPEQRGSTDGGGATWVSAGPRGPAERHDPSPCRRTRVQVAQSGATRVCTAQAVSPDPRGVAKVNARQGGSMHVDVGQGGSTQSTPGGDTATLASHVPLYPVASCPYPLLHRVPHPRSSSLPHPGRPRDALNPVLQCRHLHVATSLAPRPPSPPMILCHHQRPPRDPLCPRVPTASPYRSG